MNTKLPKELFAITEMTYRDYVHRPKVRAVLGSSDLFTRITFAEDIETALLLTFPNLRFSNFKRLKFQVWKLEVKSNTKILTPSQVSRRYGLPYAKEYKEWVSFQNQRLSKDTVIEITDSTAYEDITVLVDGQEKIIGRKYLLKS